MTVGYFCAILIAIVFMLFMGIVIGLLDAGATTLINLLM